MKFRLFYSLLLLLVLISCIDGNSQEKDKSFSPLVTYSKHYKEVHFGNDSVYYYQKKDSVLEKIIYKTDIITDSPIIKKFYPTGEQEMIVYHADSTMYGVLRYKSFFKSGKLQAVAYTQKEDTSFAHDEHYDFVRTDSLIIYAEDGSEKRIGNVTYTDKDSYLTGMTYQTYHGVWRTYNADGILIEEDIPLDGEGYGNPQKAYKSYYTNGQLKSYHIQGDMYAGGVGLEYLKYDSLGNKVEHATFEHLYPEWGQSYNDTFSISTIKEYYPNGKMKSIKKEKAFAQSEGYKCGKWIYYDNKGNITRTETYGDCYNFELEEEFRQEYEE
ncbi:hypothetical protein D0T84_07330 [Dysgonomonas sp. 521]|uniref:hypothetical protein n=1 Tax=Dysgonomonas sp. 521 TaxID=2302932 RepID=UPI0013D3082A|nr:hypothetical protein [Dysgonomonas sp. 521]NDV94730.1 hypothetical protein [Dysgonomonas sp. 521]